MVTREMIEIILRAEDQASQVVKQNEKNLKQFGDVAKQANDKAARASQQTQQKLSSLTKEIKDVATSTKSSVDKGASQFQRYNSKVQDSIVKFNMLDKETQEWLNRLSNAHNPQVFYELNTQCQEAVAKFNALDNATNTWKGSLDYSRSKLQLLGTDTDNLRGKIQVVGNAIPTYLGSKWEGLKSKVSSFGGFIKSNLSNALSTVKSKIQSLGDSFTGLGGIISTVIGGIGLKSMADMTIGASINRDRIQNLSYTMLGFGDTMEQFTDKTKDAQGNFKGMWAMMDDLTNSSLVSLDQLSQSASVVKQMTGANKDQMSTFIPILNDIGQRAILMGKDGSEAMGLMQAAGKGLNGEFEMLKENFGISKKALKDAGWDGTAEDIDGYTKALEYCLSQSGDVSNMMDTTNGKLTKLQKMWNVAGRSLGDDFKPFVDQAIDSVLGFVDANNDNQLDDGAKVWAKYAIGAMTAASGFATIAPTISPALQVLDNLTGKTKKALQFLGLMEAEEDALTLATLRESASQKISAATKYLTGIATATYGAIVGVLTGEITLATAAQQIWNAVMAANPIGLIIIAVAALAIAVYELGKSFGWWSDVGSMFDAIKNNVMRLWDAFIHNPNVQGLIKSIGEAWKWLQEVSQPVIDWLKGIWVQIFPESATGQWDVTRAIIEAIGFAFQVLIFPIQAVISVLQILYPYMQAFYSNCLVPLGEFLTTVFTPVWQLLGNIITMIIPYVNSLSSAFTAFANGQMSLPDLIRNVLINLWGIYTTVLTMILNAVFSWAGKLLSQGISAASNFVSGIINKILSLPGKFAVYLLQVVGRIASAGSQWISQGVSKASAMVSGILNNVSQLPGKVYTEFMNIGSRIMQAGSDLVKKATDIGKNIVNGLLNAMGIHSPGIIQESVVGEFKNMVTRVASKIKGAYDTAKSMGNAIVDGFGNPSLEVDTTNMLPNEDALKTNMGVQSAKASIDTAGINVSNSDVAGSFDKLSLQTGNALQNMVNKDKEAYESIRNNDASQLASISSNLQSKMSNMTNNVRTSMNDIVAKNKNGLNSVKNTTQTQLNSMVSKTKNANSKMIASWGVMKNGIVKAADKIKTDSTNHFTKLSNTIGGFYGKLKNPSRWGAGTPNLKSRGTATKGFGKITNAIRNASLPSYLTLSQIRRNPLIDTSKFGDYVIRDPKQNKFKVSDLLRYGILEVMGKGAGDYDSIPSPNLKVIKDTSNEWDMKGPMVGKYNTSKGFKVKEFLTGVPKITYSAFKSIAEEVFGQTQYEFYYDNDHHGNWINAFNAGSMNCLHGAQALIALANTMGLSGNLVHGHWNQFGHYWANIAGHKMDVTGWQNRRTWTPAASHAGPAPKSSSFSFADMINELKSITQNESNDAVIYDSNNGEIIINGEVKIVHDFLNLPENITASEIAELINDLPDDENWIKKLVRNVIFQKWDLREKARIESKQNRARGV